MIKGEKSMIPLSVPNLTGNEKEYVNSCLDSGWISSSGAFVNRFEEEMSQKLAIKHSVALVNGTAALHLALKIANVSANDEVIVPTLTFIAPVNAIKYVAAHPVFMDADNYYNLDVEKTIDFIKTGTVFKNGESFNTLTGRRVKALIPVHVFGNLVNLEPLLGLCKERNITIIEDATESLGGYYLSGALKGKKAGTIGDMAVFSFNGNKIITCGGGGMLVTNNSKLAQKARYLSTQAKDDAIRYVHNSVGYNYRLTNMQAALGVAQLEQLDRFVAIKQANYNLYKNKLAQIAGLKLMDQPSYAFNNSWFYALKVEAGFKHTALELIPILEKNRIESRPVWKLNHTQKPFKHNQTWKIEKATQLAANTINIPCSTSLQKEEIAQVVETLSHIKRK